MADRLRQPDALPHALRVARHLAIGGLRHVDALDRLIGARERLLVRQSVQPQRIVDELAARDAAREAVELRAVADRAEEAFGVGSRNAEHPDAAPRRHDQARHQVHQRRLAGAVRTDQARDSGRDLQVDAVDAEHVAVELRHVLEGDELLSEYRDSSRRAVILDHLLRAQAAVQQQQAAEAQQAAAPPRPLRPA